MQHFLRRFPIIFHVIGWSILGILFFVIFPLTYRISLPIEHYLYHFVLLFFLMLCYYFNSKILLPKIIWKKNGIVYFLILIGLSIGLILLMNEVEEYLKLNQKLHQILHPNQVYKSNQNLFFISIYIVIFALVIFLIGIFNHLIQNWNKEEKKKMELKDQKTKAELATLKAQINPHFFFNTLNTIHSLTYFEVEKSRSAIQKLAKMMRFVLNEEQEDYIALTEEINFIQNYIELMRFRLPETINLNVEIDCSENDLKIAPMILLTFIENAFQHGITTTKESEIELKIKVNQAILTLETRNEIVENKVIHRTKNIGIENTIKRLNIMYTSKFDYHTKILDHQYYCFLKLDLK